MTIASEVQRIKTNIANAYTSCNSKGATMPATQNSANLANCIESISGGTTPTGTLSITANGTYDVTDYASADVNVSGGGGGSTINEYANFITIPFNSTFDNMQDAISAYNQTMLNRGQNVQNDLYAPYCQSNITLGDTNNDVFRPLYFGRFKISGRSFQGHLLANATSTNNGGDYGYNYTMISSSGTTYMTTSATGDITSVNDGGVYLGKIINFGALKEIYISGICSFGNRNNVEAILMPFVKKAVISTGPFRNFTNLKYISLPSLSDLTSPYALGSRTSVGNFYGTAIKEISLPSLNSNSFGSYTNQFDNMLGGVTGCTVHFPSNLQSVIGSWSSVTSGFGGTNTIVLFDLPATT